MSAEIGKQKGWKPPPVELRTTTTATQIVDRNTSSPYLNVPHQQLQYAHASWAKGKGASTIAVVAGPHGNQPGTRCYVLKVAGKVSEAIHVLQQHIAANSAGTYSQRGLSGGGGGGGGRQGSGWEGPAHPTGHADMQDQEEQMLQAALVRCLPFFFCLRLL